MAQLFTCYAERRTRNSCRYKVHPLIGMSVKFPYVLTDNLPLGAVEFEGLAKSSFVFHDSGMMEPSEFQAESLSTTARAKFQCRECHDSF